MKTVVDEIYIDAAPAVVYGLVKQTERWPELLAHYRYVRVISDDGATKIVEMSALRGRIPARWRAEQRDDDLAPTITFAHTRGWTAGMPVVWRFLPSGSGTRVTIEHELRFRFPMSLPFVSDRIIGRFFIHHIAQRTLQCMKHNLEDARRA